MRSRHVIGDLHVDRPEDGVVLVGHVSADRCQGDVINVNTRQPRIPVNRIRRVHDQPGRCAVNFRRERNVHALAAAHDDVRNPSVHAGRSDHGIEVGTVAQVEPDNVRRLGDGFPHELGTRHRERFLHRKSRISGTRRVRTAVAAATRCQHHEQGDSGRTECKLPGEHDCSLPDSLTENGFKPNKKLRE